MKAFRLNGMAIIAILFSISFTSCGDDYDDSIIIDRVDNLENRVTQLEEICKQINTNISSLQNIVAALENNDYVTSVTPITKDGKEVGYTITFTKSQPITIYHGKDGKDGADGKDGVNGTDGKDGVTPIIGVSKDADGIYYWTLDGKWLLDSDGNKIKAIGTDGQDGESGTDGKDGITPQLKIENNFWYVSYDKGANWTKLGAAATTVDETFKDVTVNDNTVTFTLADNTTFTLPRYKAVSITFNVQEQGISAGQTVQIPYTLKGATDKTIVSASSDGNYKVKLENQTTDGGIITVIAPDSYVDGYINVLVSDGNGYTSLNVINFYEWEMNISSSEEGQPLTYSIPTDGGKVTIPLDVNFDYEVLIPEDAADWVSATIKSRAVIRNEKISLDIEPNMTPNARGCVISLLPKNGTKALAKIRIQQRSQAQTQAEKVFKNKFPQQVDDMKFTYSNGFLTKMEDDYGTATFTYNYPAKTKAVGVPDVIVEYDGSNKAPNYTIEVWVNSQGFAEEIYQTITESGGYTYSNTKTCKYDSEGHLIFMKDNRENREYTITWEDGNIIKVQTKCFFDSDNKLEWERIHDFDYYATPNSKNMLFYYHIYSIDIDEVDCLYWAGYLGIAPKNLTKSLNGSIIYHDGGYSQTENYNYTWSSNGVTIDGGRYIPFIP